jgi:outer membrane protein OmpA-like peptidoglycan-associated protein
VKKIISVVGVGIALAVSGCAQVPSGAVQELESSISQTEGGNFGTFMTHGHNCADQLYHAKSHLAEGQRVSGKFLNSGEKIIDEGRVHANEAAGHCSKAEQALSAYIDEKLAPLDARVRRLEGGSPKVVASVKLEGVFFAFDRSDLNAESRAVLDSTYSSLESKGFPRIEIAGYTDSVGSDEYNLLLSDRRAQSVMDYLVSLGVPAEKLTSRGYGENDPIASNDTDAGRAQNRRVELHFFE